MKSFGGPPQFNPGVPTQDEGTFAKHKSLKVKEYSGELNQKEFDELLSLDFQEQLQDNPPIEGVFSPEAELARIRSLPKEQKREFCKAKRSFGKL